MKLIKQSFQFVNQKGFTLKDIYKHIEYCARISYKSQDKITDDSYEKFVNMLEKRDHARPLEFGTVHLKMTSLDFQKFIHSLLTVGMINNIWLNHYHSYNEDTVYITTNYRYYLDIVKCFPNVKEYFTEEDNEYYPKRYTVHMILNRGVMDEFRTHVGLSHLAESTRYCNYSKDKFNNEITFVIPDWVDSIKEGTYTKDYEFPPMWGHDNWIDSEWFYAMCEAEKTYLTMTREYLTPQQAREVLPLSVKSELISCGFKEAWENFMRRRSPKYGDPGAHPMAAEIADKLCEEFLKRGFIDEKKI